MDRDSSAGLLAAGSGEAYEACLRQVRRGARFVVYDGVGPADDSPGWLRVCLVDTAGREWFFVDKVPVGISRVLASGTDSRVLVVRTDVDGVAAEDGTNEFRVRPDQVRNW